MTRPSKIDRLGEEVRDKIAAWRQAGYTIDEIMGACREAFPAVPGDAWPARSGFGAHIQGLDRMAEKINRSRAIATALVRKIGDAPESRQAQLNIEILHSIVTDLALAVSDKEGEEGASVTFDPKQVHDLAKALDHLGRASRADLDTTMRIRREIEREQNARVDKAAAEVGNIARESGLSAARIAELQARVAGLRINPEKPLG